jgi:hypothetical protein
MQSYIATELTAPKLELTLVARILSAGFAAWTNTAPEKFVKAKGSCGK